MIPTRIDPAARVEQICALAEQWQIDPRLAFGLYRMALMVPFGVSIISGYRTAEEQQQLEREGRPTAPDELSTHRSCPATGADLRISVPSTPANKKALGVAAELVGLRWGGGSRRDSEGIPSDWNHVDLGRRRT